MFIITINNINDPDTNTFFLRNMLEMNQFDTEKSLVGKNLLWRSLSVPFIAELLLWGIVAFELIIDFFMCRAFISVLKDILKTGKLSDISIHKTNVALAWMIGLFSCFLTGGIWFAYWIHMGAFQMAHMTGIIICVLGVLLFNVKTKELSI